MPAPYFDYTALQPELILTATIVVVLVADLLFEEREKYRTSTLAGLGCLGALVPVLYLAGNGADRTMFGGAYVVDNYALVMKALFLVAGYITILLSANYIEEGDYYQGEYYVLILTALLGMTVMASARDLVTIFVALLSLVYVGFFGRGDAWQPILWVLAAASMTVGNLIALRQTNLVRMLAYSSIAQGGFMLVPFAVANQGDGSARPGAFSATVVYLLIYAVMNLGAFAVLIAVARKTRSAEIDSYSGLFNYAPALAVTMSMFLFSLAGIPPLGGWYAKLVVFKAVIDAGTKQAVILGLVAAVNSVIALFYYARVAAAMWFRPAPADGGGTAGVPVALGAAIALPSAMILAIGIYPNLFARLGELATKGL